MKEDLVEKISESILIKIIDTLDYYEKELWDVVLEADNNPISKILEQILEQITKEKILQEWKNSKKWWYRMKRGAFISLVLWVAGLIIVFSALLSISEIEGNAKLLVLLNIVNILFIMMLSMQVLVSEKWEQIFFIFIFQKLFI